MQFPFRGELQTDTPIDLVTTIESGQTFLWNRVDAPMFSQNQSSNPIYTTTRPDPDGVMTIRLTQSDEHTLQWETTHTKAGRFIQHVFRLDENMDEIQRELISKDPHGVMEDAVDEFKGLRVVHETLYPTLISFICSTQMRVERIHKMVQSLAENYGSKMTMDGDTYSAFPNPSQLSTATEDELRELKLGYRASYVIDSAREYQSTNRLPLSGDAVELRNRLQDFAGVGPKVADCVLLYGAGYTSVVPVDTWIEKAAELYYPTYVKSSRSDTARALEGLFGEYAGFAQAYLFHYMRTKGQL